MRYQFRLHPNMKHVFLLIIGLLWFREIFITRAQERNNNSIKRPPVFRFPRRRSRSRFLRNFPENFNEDQSEQIYSTRETDLPRPRKIRAANIAAHTQVHYTLMNCPNFLLPKNQFAACENLFLDHNVQYWNLLLLLYDLVVHENRYNLKNYYAFNKKIIV